jgi:hypothetical protein
MEGFSGCQHEVDKIYDLLGYIATDSVKFLPTFRDNLSVPSSRVKSFLKKAPVVFSETSAMD